MFFAESEINPLYPLVRLLLVELLSLVGGAWKQGYIVPHTIGQSI